jgi:hypothetical protein
MLYTAARGAGKAFVLCLVVMHHDRRHRCRVFASLWGRVGGRDRVRRSVAMRGSFAALTRRLKKTFYKVVVTQLSVVLCL